jgi:UDP-N-acetyl-D-glucosamine dehydrogenase
VTDVTSRPRILAVVGQGYVGLPLALRAVDVGFRVVGVDSDERRVAALLAGESYVDDVGSEAITSALAAGAYLPTTEYSDAAGFEIAVVTVPTPLHEGRPDLRHIEAAAMSLGGVLGRGATVILESTTYPGTTDELFVPLLEKASGLTAGEDFWVGYSPERIDPGNPTWTLRTIPKVVSGIDAESARRVQAFYDELVDTTVLAPGTREAELSKLLENTFRHVNIALVNELAIFAHQLDVDIWAAIEAASTKPFGFMPFTPGPGVGGHCLPVDPSYLSWQVEQRLGTNFRFVELANDVNDRMPDYLVLRIVRLLGRVGRPLAGARIALVGLSYKANSSDIREAPSLRLVALLAEQGAHLVAVDERVESHRWPAGVERRATVRDALEGADAAVLITAHAEVDLTPLTEAGVPVLDTQNRLRGGSVERL